VGYPAVHINNFLAYRNSAGYPALRTQVKLELRDIPQFGLKGLTACVTMWTSGVALTTSISHRHYSHFYTCNLALYCLQQPDTSAKAPIMFELCLVVQLMLKTQVPICSVMLL